MKTSYRIFASLAALVAALPSYAAPEPTVTEDARIQVEFVNPGKFTDVKATSSGSNKGRDHYLGQLKNTLCSALPADCRKANG